MRTHSYMVHGPSPLLICAWSLQFRDVPIHIISESYGGKMAAGFALAISRAVNKEDLKLDFRYEPNSLS